MFNVRVIVLPINTAALVSSPELLKLPSAPCFGFTANNLIVLVSFSLVFAAFAGGSFVQATACRQLAADIMETVANGVTALKKTKTMS